MGELLRQNGLSVLKMIIIFDLDGTLLNTLDDLGYACNHALRLSGFPEHPIEAYPRMVGNGINNLIRRALPETERTEENVLRVRAHFVPYYDEHNCDFTRPYPGVPELLHTLKAQGCQLAVASNKYQAATEKIVNRFFPGIFDVVLGEREGIPRKPNPQIVSDILSTLHSSLFTLNSSLFTLNSSLFTLHSSLLTLHSSLSTLHSSLLTLNSSLIYIGDSLVDRETAANANIPFVACSWGFVPREQLVDGDAGYVADHPQDILLFTHIARNILPQYDAFDAGHRRDHAETVIQESLKLARASHADERMAYVVAAYHDLGLRFDRENHHIHSGRILMEDEALHRWFTPEQLTTMRDAVEDHRASGEHPPRSLYGAIVAEADRQIQPLTVIRRTMAFSAALFPEADFETLYRRSREHLLEKYAEGGYLRLWLRSERNVMGLQALRTIIADEEQLRAICRNCYDNPTESK